MKIFSRKIVPVIIIANFLLSYSVMTYLVHYFTWSELDYNDWTVLIIELLLISIMNFVIIVVTKKKHGDEFSALGYIIFVITIPSISPVIMYYFVVFISKIFAN